MTGIGPSLDLGSIPWSRRGSFMTLTTLERVSEHPGREAAVEPGLYLHDVSGNRLFRWNGVFRLEGLEDGVVQPLEVRSATPARLELATPSGAVEVTWDGPDTLRFRGRGTGLRLTQAVIDPFGAAVAFPLGERSWRLLMGMDAHYAAIALEGELRVEAPRSRTGAAADGALEADRKVVDVLPGPAGAFELALSQYESGYLEPAAWQSFDDCEAGVGAEFSDWLASRPPVPAGLEAARALAAYVTWSAVVGPRGLLSRPLMLMSKNWMYSAWSWDHCFNAIGLAKAVPDLAWEQLMSMFDHQHPQGALPDILNDSTRMWGCVKPPVHGWTLRQLDAAGVVTDARLAEIYPRLGAWTDWWTTYRNDGGLCQYFHGNDSGWDNATAFDMGFPVVSPDLATFLIIQMDVLADAAARLGRPAEAGAWRDRADAMLALLLERLWDGERFRVLRADDLAETAGSRSLVPLVPMLLGDRLPPEVRGRLVANLEAAGNVTSVGPATESPSSPLYEPDGYWRGPVWAPTTLLLVDGLDACGEHELAADVARRFVETCRRSGFAENYDAHTGEPLRDPAYTWSASVFTVLAGRPDQR